jgi:FAD/FMN-containing dehydrogenase/Fe-S oxidoreductase
MSDAYTLSLYSTDASIYEITPLLVVYPADEADVCACLRFSHERGVPLIVRGAGSGLAGETLGRAIILDMSARMNRVGELDTDLLQVTVQAGVVLDSLNRSLAPHGLRFGPDPASSARCTIGGMIGNNSSGARSLRYGDTRSNVVSLRLCFSDGTTTIAEPVQLGSPAYEQKTQEPGRAGEVWRDLPGLLRQNAELIAARRPKVERNRSGYLLYDVLAADILDLTRLICGSEGTLAVVTEAVLKVERVAGHTGMAVVYFDTLLDAARAVPPIRGTQPMACELLDAELMTLGRQARPDLAHLLPADAGALLILEYHAPEAAVVAAQLDALRARFAAIPHRDIKLVTEPREQVALWATRTAATPYLYRRTDDLQPAPFVEDAAVPPERLADYLEKVTEILAKYNVPWSSYAHAGSGEVHLKPMLDLRHKEDVEMLETLAAEIHAAVWECDGTISGEHGEGLARAQWIRTQAGSDLYAVFKQVKALFDPKGLLNPDKKITSNPHLMTQNLRLGPTFKFGLDMPPSKLNWAPGELEHEAIKCCGCGNCRSTGPEIDMCPRFRHWRVEAAAPRARANIVRRLLAGRQKEGGFASRELMYLMDYCFNCKRCIADCPSGVNIPKLVLEARTRYYETRGLPLDKLMCATVETSYRLGRFCPPLVNMLNEAPLVRWLMEKLIGLDRRRPLPRLKRWNLRRRFPVSERASRPRVVFYADLYARYNAPEITQAAIDVLEHNGFEVLLPDVPWCNMPALEEGAVAMSRRHIRAVVSVLAPFALQGVPIVTTEPTACLALRSEFLDYDNTDETRLVSRNVWEISEFLAALRQQKKLRTDFRATPTVFGYNQACHQSALRCGMPGLDLLKLIPGITVRRLDEGCCGMAGTFGLRHKSYDEAMAIGRGLFAALNDPERGIQFGVCESSACRMQMEHGSGKRTLHPVEIMAAAYGYPPAVPQAGSWDIMDRPAPPENHADAAAAEPSHADASAAPTSEPGVAPHGEHSH